jgi:hypothetical protein
MGQLFAVVNVQSQYTSGVEGTTAQRAADS